MTLTIHTEEDEQRQLMLTVEVAEERVAKVMRQKARKLGRDIRIPGFRRGKVPYKVLERRVGRKALRAEAIEEMVPAIFKEALEDVGADMYAQPRLENMESEPLVFQFTVPLMPRVELGDYREIRKEIEPVVITDEAVDEALERIRIQHAVIEPVERPVEEGDLVTLSGKGEVVRQEDAPLAADDTETAVELETAGQTDAEPASDEAADDNNTIIFDQEHIELLVDSDKLFSGAPFVENIVGLSAGDEKSFSFVFPEDFGEEDLAGKEATFNVTILDVKSRQLPELDDDLAQQEGDYESLAALRSALHGKLGEQAEAQAQKELIEGVVDEMLADAEIAFPPAALESEIDGMVENLKNQMTRSGWQWEDFLKMQGGNEQVIRDGFRENAAENLRHRLVLRQFIFDEKLTVEAADVDAAIAERVSQYESEDLKKSIGDYFRNGTGFDMISNKILADKIYHRMKDILTGNAPDLDALESEAVADGAGDATGEEE